MTRPAEVDPRETHELTKTTSLLSLLVRFTQGMDGLLAVAGNLLVMTGMIPENSLRKTHQ